MGTCVDFPGSNLTLLGNGDTVSDIQAFSNGPQVVTKWRFTEEELKNIIETGEVWVSLWCGDEFPPMYVGDKDSVRYMTADNGVWKE